MKNTIYRSLAVLCMLYKIRCNPMHPLNGALPGPYVPVRVTCGALVALRYTYAPPRCNTSQYHRTFIFLSVFLWNDLADPVFNGVGLVVSRAGPMFFIGLSCSIPTIVFQYFSLSLLSVYMLVNCGAGVFELIACTSLSLSLALTTSFNNKNNNNNKNKSFTLIHIHSHFPVNTPTKYFQ